MLWPYQPPDWPERHGPIRFVHYCSLLCECGWETPILPSENRAEEQRRALIAHAAGCGRDAGTRE